MTIPPPVQHAIRALQVTSAQFLRRERFHHPQCHACLQGRHPTGARPIFHRRYRIRTNRFENSESVGSNAHLWCLQPRRRRLLYDLLLPLPSTHAQASQIRRLVSTCASTFEHSHPSTPKSALPLMLSISASLHLARICPILQSPHQRSFCPIPSTFLFHLHSGPALDSHVFPPPY